MNRRIYHNPGTPTLDVFVVNHCHEMRPLLIGADPRAYHIPRIPVGEMFLQISIDELAIGFKESIMIRAHVLTVQFEKNVLRSGLLNMVNYLR